MNLTMKNTQSTCDMSDSYLNNFAVQAIARLSTARAANGVERGDRTSVLCTADLAPENHRDLGASYVS